jgi:hypothetical protein
MIAMRYPNIGATPSDKPGITEEDPFIDWHPSHLMIRWEIPSREESTLPRLPDDLMTDIRNHLLICSRCSWLSDAYEQLPRITLEEILTGEMEVDPPVIPDQR